MLLKFQVFKSKVRIIRRENQTGLFINPTSKEWYEHIKLGSKSFCKSLFLLDILWFFFNFSSFMVAHEGKIFWFICPHVQLLTIIGLRSNGLDCKRMNSKKKIIIIINSGIYMCKTHTRAHRWKAFFFSHFTSRPFWLLPSPKEYEAPAVWGPLASSKRLF